MLTVPQAAARARRNPETVRRWIRSGRLRAQRVGTQHIIDERDLLALIDVDVEPAVPAGMRVFPDGSPQPDWVALLREDRQEH